MSLIVLKGILEDDGALDNCGLLSIKDAIAYDAYGQDLINWLENIAKNAENSIEAKFAAILLGLILRDAQNVRK